MTANTDPAMIAMAERQSGRQPKGPAVIVGLYGHCLAPGHEGQVVSTPHGYALRTILKEHPNGR